MSNQNVIFNIPDMHCESCPKLIKVTLLEMDGVNEVSTSLETKTATINFDDTKTSSNALIQAIKEIGYTATLNN